ncbi:MAG: hypothetical protein ABFR53_08875 [Actinomycetota bacterium]
MNRILMLAAFAALTASCAGATVDEAADTRVAAEVPATSTSTLPAHTQADESSDEDSPSRASDNPALAGTTTTTEAVTEEKEASPPPDGEPAPDFVLDLGEDGGEVFALSAETKPVFMIFWAEW